MAAGLQERPWTILAVARRMDPDREIVAPSSRYPACPCQGVDITLHMEAGVVESSRNMRS